MREEEREWVTIKSGADKLFGVIHRPRNASNFPGVVICHGYAGTKSGRYRIYVDLATLLSKAGIMTLRFDFRGCGDSEGDFKDITLKREVEDALHALQFLTEIPGIDKKRIGMLGKSLGGVVAILAASQVKLIKSLALLSSPFPGIQWKEEWDRFQNSHMKANEWVSFGGQLTHQKVLKDLFSLDLENYLNQLSDIPLLHIHGEKDKLVDLTHAAHYERLRQRASSLTKIFRPPSSDHDFSDLKEREFVIQEVAKWFKETL